MKIKYDIEESILVTKLGQEYGISVESLGFIPMGDSAYSYQVIGVSGERFYLKLFDHANDGQRKGLIRIKKSLPLTWRMYHEGLFRNLTYPIKTRTGDFIITLQQCSAVMFNFIEGETLAEAYPFSDRIVANIGKLVARIQQTTPYVDRSTVPAETYDISFGPDLEECITSLERTPTFDDPILRALQEQVLSKKHRITAMLELIRNLRSALMAAPKETVLSHGDLWGGNLIELENEYYVIDWESVLMAPLERDLMGYIGEEFEVFFSAYARQLGQSVSVNPDILRFYSYRHHLRNLSNWLMNILYRNLDNSQNENDLEMIVYHCMNRWDEIEPNLKGVEAILKKRK